MSGAWGRSGPPAGRLYGLGGLGVLTSRVTSQLVGAAQRGASGGLLELPGDVMAAGGATLGDVMAR